MKDKKSVTFKSRQFGSIVMKTKTSLSFYVNIINAVGETFPNSPFINVL